MKIFLTGATGYLGNQLAFQLVSQNYEVHALVRNINASNVPKHKNIHIFQGDICDYNSILKGITGCEVVIHTAAYTNLRSKNPENFYKINVEGTQNLLNASIENNIKKFIYTSSLAVYGPSGKNSLITEKQSKITSFSNNYERTKSIAEDLFGEYGKKGLSCVVLNISKIYGPGLNSYSNGVNKIVQKIKNDKFLVVPSRLNISSNYVFIHDVVQAHVNAIDWGKAGEKYIIGGENLSYEQLFKTVKNLTNSNIKIIKINYKLIRACFSTLTFIKTKLGLQVLVTPKVLDSLFTNRESSSEKAMNQLQYTITPLNSALTQTIQYLK